MDFRNATALDGFRLYAAFIRHTAPWSHEKLTVRVRYGRGAAFSGAFYYATNRIFINLGRHNRYPYRLIANIARARSNATHWWREGLYLELADAYQLALFIYLHELFHYLVKAAGRTTRHKEAMCDRFAARVLIDDYACPLRDKSGAPVPREAWEFQDLDRFVSAAPRALPTLPRPPLREIPVRFLEA